MQRELEQFRKTYVRRKKIGDVIRAVMLLLCLMQLILLVGGDGSSIIGMLIPVILLSLKQGGLYTDKKVLQDEAKLKAAWIAENDERSIAIRAKAGEPVVQWMSIIELLFISVLEIIVELVPMPRKVELMLVGAVVSLMVVALGQFFASWLLKRYWEKRM